MIRQRNRPVRRGSVLTLLAFLLPVLLILAAFTINAAYMQLTRTQLMVATDASARAGGRALSEFQDIDEARVAARVTAAQNEVAGRPLRIRSGDQGDVDFGMAAPSGDSGRFAFTKVANGEVVAGSTANAVRVSGKRTADSRSGAVDVVFKGFGSSTRFEPTMTSVAMQVDRDIVLVLDRSGSMGWKDYAWPSNTSPFYRSTLDAGVAAGYLIFYQNAYYYNSGVTQTMYFDWVWEDHYNLGPAPPSPWDELVVAVGAFLEVLRDTPQSELVGLASYSSGASEDIQLTSDYDSILQFLSGISPDGMTAIGRGMQEGEDIVMHPTHARPYAAKTLVVMTDGMHNTGIDPVTVGQQIASQTPVTIHSVTFSAGADQQRMQRVADLGGGQHYHADDGVALVDTFRQIANNLPTILTE